MTDKEESLGGLNSGDIDHPDYGSTLTKSSHKEWSEASHLIEACKHETRQAYIKNKKLELENAELKEMVKKCEIKCETYEHILFKLKVKK